MTALMARLIGPVHARRYRLMLALFAVAGALQGIAFVLVLPLLRAVFVGRDIGGWTLALIITAALATVMDYLAQSVSFRTSLPIGRELHRRLGDHLVTLPLGWFGGDRVGRLGRLTAEGVLEVLNTIAHTQRRLVVAVASPAAVLVGAFVVEWRVGLVLAVATPIVAGMFRVTSWAGRLIDDLSDRTAAEAGDRVVEYARTQPVQRAFGRTSDRFAALDDAFTAQRRAMGRMLRRAVPAVVGFVVSTQLAFLVCLVGGAALVVHGSVDLATLLGTLILVLKFLEPLQNAGPLSLKLRMERGSVERLLEVFDTEPLPEPSGAHPEIVSSGSAPAIEFRNVDFAYTRGEPVLADVSFAVPSGGTVALVGPSGSGKTTVARLVARFYDVDAGAVLVDGADVREQSSRRLLATVAPVFQDVFLFAGTIEDNIRLARQDASAEQFAAACAAARVDEIADRLPDGWQTQVGEGGTALSGGERQRVSLARALLKDAPIVLLDEPTASIDSENEAAIAAALDELTRDRTVLVIAHRLQTIRNADTILVLEQGRITERGTHEQLLARHGTYERFWEQRARAAEWTLA